MEKKQVTEWSKEEVESLNKFFKTQSVIDYLEEVLFWQAVNREKLVRQHNLLYPNEKLSF